MAPAFVGFGKARDRFGGDSTQLRSPSRNARAIKTVKTLHKKTYRRTPRFANTYEDIKKCTLLVKRILNIGALTKIINRTIIGYRFISSRIFAPTIDLSTANKYVQRVFKI